MRDGTCNSSGIVPIIYWDSTCHLSYTARYLPFLRYHACYLYGTVPAIFAVPCLLFIRDGTCHEAVLCLLFIGTVPAIFAVPCPFCIRHGTMPILYTAQYLQFLRYRAHSVYGTVPPIFAVPCLLFIWHGTCHFCGTVPVIYTGWYLPFLRYRACYLYGTVPAMKRYCACYLLGQYLQFLRYRAHCLSGTIPAIYV